MGAFSRHLSSTPARLNGRNGRCGNPYESKVQFESRRLYEIACAREARTATAAAGRRLDTTE